MDVIWKINKDVINKDIKGIKLLIINIIMTNLKGFEWETKQSLFLNNKHRHIFLKQCVYKRIPVFRLKRFILWRGMMMKGCDAEETWCLDKCKLLIRYKSRCLDLKKDVSVFRSM